MNELLFFAGFLSFIAFMLMLDLGVFSKGSHVISFKEASIWSAIWVILALCFYGILLQWGDKIHGIESVQSLQTVINMYSESDEIYTVTAANLTESLDKYRSDIALEFITGYLLEYSLSADNIFVIILIFSSFGVREKYYKKVLLWGIIGAVIMRFFFIFAGSVLIQQFHGILYVFGGFLIFSGGKMLFSDDDEEIDPTKHPVVRMASRFFSVIPRYVKGHFFVRNKAGKLFITPLFVVVLIIEFTDLLFAVDSVPAVFSVTKDPYIVFFSNIFAIMGLRSMFFFLSNIMHLFHYLKTGLSFLLIFIGVKMLAHDWLKALGFKTEYSLMIILGILAISIIASLLFPKKAKEEHKNTISHTS